MNCSFAYSNESDRFLKLNGAIHIYYYKFKQFFYYAFGQIVLM